MTADRPTLTVSLPSFSAQPPGDWVGLFALARAADQAGIDRVVVSDHVVFGENLEAYGQKELGGVEGGQQPTGPDGLWLEPLTVLAMVGAQTSRIRLSTGILLAALRRPSVLAKTIATLDVLTEGRVDLGVGVGWQREEYEAAGLDFADRGRLLDTSLEVCHQLWTETTASVHTDHLDFDGIHAMPKPHQKPGVPIWVSGTINPRVLRRIVRFGSGWIPWGASAQDLPTSIAAVHQALTAAGRDPAGFAVTAGLAVSRGEDGQAYAFDRAMQSAVDMVELGVTDFRVRLRLPSDADELAGVLAELVTAFRAATT